MNRIVPLLDYLRAILAPLIAPRGPLTNVVVADYSFTRSVLGQGGPYGLPLVGVAYGGTPNARSFDTGGGIYAGAGRLALFVVVEPGRDIASELTDANRGLYPLVDRVIYRLSGRRPVAVSAAGVPLKVDDSPYPINDDGYLLDDEGAVVLLDGAPISPFDLPMKRTDDFQYLGGKFDYKSDGPLPLPEEANRRGLRGWQILFNINLAFVPEFKDAAPEHLGTEINMYLPADPTARPDDIDLLGLITGA